MLLRTIHRQSRLFDLIRRQMMDLPAAKRLKSSDSKCIFTAAEIESSTESKDRLMESIETVIQRSQSDCGPLNGVKMEERSILVRATTFQGDASGTISKKSTVITRPHGRSVIGQAEIGQSSVASGSLDSFGNGLPLAEQLINLEMEQTVELQRLRFGPPIATVYHPIEYASQPHSDYVRRYCQSPKMVIFVGMNPGPFGMVQSGVPFGDCRIVREWLGISGIVKKPDNENAQRPIVGLQCNRSEVSGTRLWGFIRSLAKNDDPNSFFKHCYVHNYCPAAFLNAKGTNITPPTLKKAELSMLEAVCDDYFWKAVKLLQPRIVVGIGNYAFERCRRVLEKVGQEANGIRVEMIMHPSPANPATNTGGGWPVKVREQLEKLDLIQYMSSNV